MLSELKVLIGLMLTEGRKDDVKKQFPDVDVEGLAASDPSGTFKYLQWMAKQVKAGTSPDEVKDLVNQFHKIHSRLQKKDIYQYTFNELRAALNSAPTMTKRQERDAAKAGGHIVYEDEFIYTYYMETPEACQFYGKGSKWCITGHESDGPAAWSQYRNDFDRLTQFYFIIRKKPLGDEFDKIAIDFPTAEPDEPEDPDESQDEHEPEFYDARDKVRTEREITKAIPSFRMALSAVEKDAHHRPDEDDRVVTKYNGVDPHPKRNVINTIKNFGPKLPDHELQTLLLRIEKTGYERRTEFEKYVSELQPGAFKQKIWANLPHESKKRLARSFMNDPDPKISKEAKITFLKDPRKFYSSSEASTQAQLSAFANDPDPDIRAVIAADHYTNSDLLEKLAEDPDAKVRAATVAPMRYRKKLDSTYIHKFLYDKDPIVRAALANTYVYVHKAEEGPLDPKILHILVTDESPLVRREAAKFKSLTQEEFIELAKDSDNEVRINVAWNSATPDEIRDAMIDSEQDPETKEKLMKARVKIINDRATARFARANFIR